ncbi:MAG: hypothetical protein KDA93_01470 [Planctomycetaceae bacterium]|nr:hypothetical protein [Planctomycetaceae bacterium]
MDKTHPHLDPATVLDRLSAADVARRLVDLDAEAKGLRVLLRSLRARESARKDNEREIAR